MAETRRERYRPVVTIRISSAVLRAPSFFIALARCTWTVRAEMQIVNGRPTFVDVPGSEQVWEAELVLLAMGFVGPEKGALLEQLGVEFTPQGNVKSDGDRMTTVPGVFTAGDMTRGQSLIVWAIAEGRHAAAGVDAYLMGASDLPRPLDFGNDQRPFV